MVVANRVVNITEFKARYLALFDKVESGDVSITVTRRGKVVGILNPPPKGNFVSTKDSWAGKIKIVGDILNIEMSEMWDAVKGWD